MPSSKLTMTFFLFFLEMVLVSVVAGDTTTIKDSTHENISETTESSIANVTSLPALTANITDNSNTSTPAPQNNKNGSSDSFTSVFSSNSSKAATVGPTTASVRPLSKLPPPVNPAPVTPTTTTTQSTTRKSITTVKTTNHKTASADHIVIIVLGLIVLVVIAAGAICIFTRRRVRRYSVDLSHRADEANIPLSTVEPGLPAEAVPLNGLQTFEGTETSAKEPEKQEVKPETQEEQKTEVGEPAAGSSSASAAAAAAPAPDSSEDKPKEDGEEGSSPAEVKPSSEEKTDDEGAVSNKTSVESLKEINENNSNNAGSGQKTDVQTGNTLQEVCVDCLV